MSQLQTSFAMPTPTAGVRSTLVNEGARMGFLPRHFKPRVMLLVESKTYAWMERLCRVYSGGKWNYFDLSNGGAFLAPQSPDAFDLHIESLHVHRSVSAEVAGIISTAFALRSLSWAGHTGLTEKYCQLLAYVDGHPDRALVLEALE